MVAQRLPGQTYSLKDFKASEEAPQRGWPWSATCMLLNQQTSGTPLHLSNEVQVPKFDLICGRFCWDGDFV